MYKHVQYLMWIQIEINWITANQWLHHMLGLFITTQNYLIRFQQISICMDGEKSKTLSQLENGLAYTSFPVQQSWNLKCYRIDINSYKQHYVHSVKISHLCCSFHLIEPIAYSLLITVCKKKNNKKKNLVFFSLGTILFFFRSCTDLWFGLTYLFHQ